jgi:hypothetical protein
MLTAAARSALSVSGLLFTTCAVFAAGSAADRGHFGVRVPIR